MDLFLVFILSLCTAILRLNVESGYEIVLFSKYHRVYIKVISKIITVKSPFSGGIFLYVELTIIKILTIINLLYSRFIL